MAPLLAAEASGQHKSSDARRRAALEEAASVLLAVSTGGSAAGAPAVVADGALPKGARGGVGPPRDDGDSSSTAAAAAADAPAASLDGGEEGAKSAAAAPKQMSRSDAVAAAKRRAEERRRAASSSKHGDRKPPAVAATTTTSATTTTTKAADSRSSQNKLPSQIRRISSSSGGGSQSMDWFNLLGVVTNPGSGYYHDGPGFASSPASSSHYGNRSYHYHRSSRHGGLSSHGTPISLDHVGSDGTRGSLGGGGVGSGGDEGTVAASLLNAAGLNEWADLANASSAQAEAALSNVATQLDEFTGWFDHYSRKYLGTIDNYSHPILGEFNQDNADGEGGGISAAVMNNLMHPHPAQIHPSMLAEYEPEFGPDDVPSSQLEELPIELSGLDLASVENFLRGSGMLGMRFEDRGGGFGAARERARERRDGAAAAKEEEEEEEGDGEEKKVDSPAVSRATAAAPGEDEGGDDSAGAVMMADVEATVPPVFFSPYFDLTDPVCFESLLVISDEEVAQIREKEAQLHALADRKVKEAEEVARRDAENENLVPRPPPRKGGAGEGEEGDAVEATKSSGTSLTKGARTASTPGAGGDTVITLRKPETFTSHLDAVELVLLDQVRSKSERFFRETNRFSELQRLVSTSVDEVRELRTELHSIRERCVTNVEVIPAMDDGRRDLRGISRVLEAAEDVVNCKASIASLMGAGDHLGAVEAIRLARELLRESPPEEDDEDEGGEGGDERDPSLKQSSSHSSQQHHNRHLSLGKLKALSKVSEQLNEYEKLVVQNLTDELVETFLSWGTSENNNNNIGGGGGGGGAAHRGAPPRISLTTSERAEVRGVVRSLRVCGRLGGAGEAYRRKLCDLISVTVRAIVTECVADAAKNNSSGGGGGSGGLNGDGDPGGARGTMAGVAQMSLDQFFDCIGMLFEQVLGLLWGAFAVNRFCIDEGFILDDAAAASSSSSANAPEAEASSSNANGGGAERRQPQHTPSATAAALAAAADLSEKSVSELLRLRREAHSLVTFDGMRRLWDTSLAFTHRLEKLSGRKAYGLRSTLLAQAKSFVERKHESNMSALVAALDGERWVQCNVSAERQAALTRLCTGRAAFSSRKTSGETASSGAAPATGPSAAGTGREKATDAEVEGARYKVVWSCLLLLEMVMDDVACAAHFQTLAANVVSKVSELLRLFNARSTQLVLGAGAIHSAARLKSINAKHLAIVTQCIALVLAILPHVRAALMAQLPPKQHALLHDLDKIKADYKEHSEKVLGKLVSIIGGIVEHSLAPRIANTDFDARASEYGEASSDAAAVDDVKCCQFLGNVVTNTRKMHQVLLVMLPPELLRDVFSRIFAYLDHKVPSLFKNAATSEGVPFSLPDTDGGKLRMIGEVEHVARTLNGLPGVQPWNFTAAQVLERELDIRRGGSSPQLMMKEEKEEGGASESEEEQTGGKSDGENKNTSAVVVDDNSDDNRNLDSTSEAGGSENVPGHAEDSVIVNGDDGDVSGSTTEHVK